MEIKTKTPTLILCSKKTHYHGHNNYCTMCWWQPQSALKILPMILFSYHNDPKGRYLITPISMKESRLRLLLLKDTQTEQWNRNSLLDSKSPNPDCYNDSLIKTLCENKRGSDSVWKKKGLIPKVFACVNHSNSFLCEKWKWWPSFCSQIFVTKFLEKAMWK